MIRAVFRGMEEFLHSMEEGQMNINIKSAEAHRLAVALARKTGDSITGAVTKAIKAELRRHENNEEKLARIQAMLDYTASVLRDGPGSADIDALLYDEMGLPK